MKNEQVELRDSFDEFRKEYEEKGGLYKEVEISIEYYVSVKTV